MRVALVALWGGFTLALLSHVGAYPLPIKWLVGGFDVALIWLWVALPGTGLGNTPASSAPA